jgi:hypothetical protein
MGHLTIEGYFTKIDNDFTQEEYTKVLATIYFNLVK